MCYWGEKVELYVLFYRLISNLGSRSMKIVIHEIRLGSINAVLRFRAYLFDSIFKKPVERCRCQYI